MSAKRVLLVLIAGIGVCAAQEWRPWSPREEIAPQSERQGDQFVLSGGGNPAVYGGWVGTVRPVEGGTWYRLQARYHAEGLDAEPNQVIVRLDWKNAAGQRQGQPDYAWRIQASGDARDVALEAPAPAGAVAVDIQLLLANAPRGRVRFESVRLAPVEAPKERPVRVVSIRLRPKGSDPVSKFLELARRQSSGRADIVLLPEGITMVGTGKSYAEVAEPVPGPTTERLGEAARASHAWLAAGLYEREGKAIYNTAVLLDREGKLVGKYRKAYLPREEFDGGLTPGSEFPVFDTDFGRVGLMICWDLQYPDPARALALRGAEIILMPIWGGNLALGKARAIENHVFLVSSGYDYPSMVINPNGETLAMTESDNSAAKATVDLNQRFVDPWLGEMRGRFFRESRVNLTVDPPGRK